MRTETVWMILNNEWYHIDNCKQYVRCIGVLQHRLTLAHHHLYGTITGIYVPIRVAAATISTDNYWLIFLYYWLQIWPHPQKWNTGNYGNRIFYESDALLVAKLKASKHWKAEYAKIQIRLNSRPLCAIQIIVLYCIVLYCMILCTVELKIGKPVIGCKTDDQLLLLITSN